MPMQCTPKPLRRWYEDRIFDALDRYRAAVASRADRSAITLLAREVEAAAGRQCTPPMWHAKNALAAVREGLVLARLDGVPEWREDTRTHAEVMETCKRMSDRLFQAIRDLRDEGEEWKRGDAA